MKTKQLISGAFMLSASLLAAQAVNKPVTVKIKKTEIVNGVEKTSDTTFTSSDPAMIKANGQEIDIAKIKNYADSLVKKNMGANGNDNDMQMGDNTFIFTNDSTIRFDKTTTFTIDKSIHKNGQPVMVKPAPGHAPEGMEGSNETIQIYVIKKTNHVEASDDELALLSKKAGKTDGMLKTEKLELYPNPNNGKFNLNFSLPQKGDTQISILDMEGQKVYDEQLSNFSGNYNKEIDISKNPKGAYFVCIEQGGHAQVKKIVLE